jgi:hypothetical protein
MSRDRLFAAQFLAVAMFLLFLPGVSRPGSTGNTSSVLKASTATSGSFSGSSDSDAFKSGRRFSVGARNSSLMFSGKIEHDGDRDDHGSDSGSHSGSASGSTHDGDRDDHGSDSGSHSGSASGSTHDGSGSGDHVPVVTTSVTSTLASGGAGTASDPIMSVPAPESISLLVLGIVVLVIRKMLTVRQS